MSERQARIEIRPRQKKVWFLTGRKEVTVWDWSVYFTEGVIFYPELTGHGTEYDGLACARWEAERWAERNRPSHWHPEPEGDSYTIDF